MLREKYSSVDKYTCRKFIFAYGACLLLLYIFVISMEFVFPSAQYLHQILTNESINYAAIGLGLSWTISDLEYRGLFRSMIILGWPRWRSSLAPLLVALSLYLTFTLVEAITTDQPIFEPLTIHVSCGNTLKRESNTSRVDHRYNRSLATISISDHSPLCQSVKINRSSIRDVTQTLNEMRSINLIERGEKSTLFVLRSLNDPVRVKMGASLTRLLILFLCLSLLCSPISSHILASLTTITLVSIEVLLSALS